MKNILFLFFLGSSLIVFNGCDKDTSSPSQNNDPCESIVCYNGGYCVNGECLCPDGYTGPDCSQQVTPTKIRITKIEVTDFPATDENGAGWDLLSGADIYPVILKGSNVLWTSSRYFEDASPSSLYSFTVGLPFDITSPQDSYTIRLYDFDTIDADDYMGGIIFTPYFNTNGFPSTRNLSVGDFSFKIYLSYVW